MCFRGAHIFHSLSSTWRIWFTSVYCFLRAGLPRSSSEQATLLWFVLPASAGFTSIFNCYSFFPASAAEQTDCTCSQQPFKTIPNSLKTPRGWSLCFFELLWQDLRAFPGYRLSIPKYHPGASGGREQYDPYLIITIRSDNKHKCSLGR